MRELAPTTFTIPTVETERMFLRAPREEDIAEEVAFFQTERSHDAGGPLPEAQVWVAIASIIGHWALRGYGFWALEEKATGAYLGRTGVWYPRGWPEAEIGWTLMPNAEGRGLAHEAAEAARGFAYDALGMTTLVSVIAPGNTRSETLARRLGAVPERHWTSPAGLVSMIWRHPGPGVVAEATPKGALDDR